jgi:hypothetical protein
MHLSSLYACYITNLTFLLKLYRTLIMVQVKNTNYGALRNVVLVITCKFYLFFLSFHTYSALPLDKTLQI